MTKLQEQFCVRVVGGVLSCRIIRNLLLKMLGVYISRILNTQKLGKVFLEENGALSVFRCLRSWA